ncbi:MAG: thioredoxin protein, partial [Humibacillus sp.]|nr:thioredoxin protein [Humibacillus sp.]
KMLYDNALLLRAYTSWWRATGSPLARRVVEEVADFLVRDLGTPQGGFASSLDADAAGVEGLTYAWTPAQLGEVLGAADGVRAATLLEVTPEGTFEHGSSTLQLLRDPDAADTVWFGSVRARLLAARADRPQPGRDDKVVTSWNGLAITALAGAGAVLGRPDWVEAAARCADHVLSVHVSDGRLLRASRDGEAGRAEAVADDLGNLAEGLLALHQATGDPRWLDEAARLLDDALARFGADDGGFHDTAVDAESLYLRPRNASDNAEPSGQSALAGALVTLGALTGDPVTIERGARATEAGLGLAALDPRFAGWSLAVAEAIAAGPVQVAVVGDGPRASELLAAARGTTSPGAVVVAGAPDARGIPLLADRPLVQGNPAAYVCRGFVCDLPVTDVAGLEAALSRTGDDGSPSGPSGQSTVAR